MATLYPPDVTSVNGNNSVGYHYFLSEPLAQGGKPTFSFSMKAGKPLSAIPESTVKGSAEFCFSFMNHMSKYLFSILRQKNLNKIN